MPGPLLADALSRAAGNRSYDIMGRKEGRDSMMNVLQVSVGDIATLRKQHPCGGFSWTVTRVGADIGLECARCGRRVFLDREEFERRVRGIDAVGSGLEAETAIRGEAS